MPCRKCAPVCRTPSSTRARFKQRFREQFTDPAFDSLQIELNRLADAAWKSYSNGRKSPHTAKAGAEFADPDFELSVEWLAARQAIKDAQARHDQKELPSRILLINGSSRSDHTCPGEMSKSWRLAVLARRVLEEEFRLEEQGEVAVVHEENLFRLTSHARLPLLT